HGDFLVLASYISLAIISAFGIHPFVSLIIVIPVMFVIGFLVQNTMLNRVLSKGAEPPLMVTFGISIVIQNLLLYFFSADAQNLKSTIALKSIAITDIIRIPVIYFISFLVGVALILILALYFKNTYQGKAIKAASDDREVAQLMGVNIKNI